MKTFFVRDKIESEGGSGDSCDLSETSRERLSEVLTGTSLCHHSYSILDGPSLFGTTHTLISSAQSQTNSGSLFGPVSL